MSTLHCWSRTECCWSRTEWNCCQKREKQNSNCVMSVIVLCFCWLIYFKKVDNLLMNTMDKTCFTLNLLHKSLCHWHYARPPLFPLGINLGHFATSLKLSVIFQKKFIDLAHIPTRLFIWWLKTRLSHKTKLAAEIVSKNGIQWFVNNAHVS